MSMTAADILGNADLFRAAYPHWPHAEPEAEPVLAEITIGWGEDTVCDTACGTCLNPLPAGAPAWAAGDEQPLSSHCAPTAHPDRHSRPMRATQPQRREGCRAPLLADPSRVPP